jgi:hypothetical protein
MDSSASAPSSPPARRLRQPSWLDLRLVLGVLLVLASVLLGARVVTAADHSTRVWATTRAIAAGTTVQADDVRPMRVRLYDNAADYLAATVSPAGRTVTRDVGAGELLPRGVLTAAAPGRLLSLPVDALHAPDSLSRGQRIDVFATTKDLAADAQAAGKTVKVLSAVPVQGVRRPSGGLTGSGTQLTVLVRVSPRDAGAVVTALRDADLDLSVVVGPRTRGGAAAGGVAG